MKPRLKKWFYNELLRLFESERYSVLLYQGSEAIMVMDATLEGTEPYRFSGLASYIDNDMNGAYQKLVLEPDNINICFCVADDTFQFIKSKCKNVGFSLSAALDSSPITEVSFEPFEMLLTNEDIEELKIENE